ncbi:MAG: TolC family protein [Archangium sp.]|nr:TolC family protein [Archangium sp.]
MISPALMTLVLAVGDAPVLPESPLQLGEVLTVAEQAFPSLVAARADVEGASGEQLTAAGAFDPVWRTRAWTSPVSGYPHTRLDSVIEVPTPLWGANFFAGYRLGLGKIPDYYRERETLSGGEVRAGVNVPVLRNGPIDRRRANLARAELSQQLAGLSLDQQRLEVTRLAAFRYWDWVAAGHRREIARALLQTAKDRDAQLAARAKEGDVPVFDREDNQRALAQRQALLVQAQRALEQSSFELSLFLRDAQGNPVMPGDARLPPVFPQPDLSTREPPDLEAALVRRPELQRLLAQKKQQEIELRFQENQVLPLLDVGVAFTQDFGNTPEEVLKPLANPELEFNAVLEVPLLYRAPLGRVQSARAGLSRLEAQARLASDRVVVDVRDALSALSAASERITFTRQEVAVSIRLEQGERTRFELGDSTLLFVNLREQATAEARLREIDSLTEHHKANAALRAALAAP